jgi:putative acetyltransferase
VGPFVIAVDDPRRHDVQALLRRHLAFARDNSPPEDVHALDLTGLLDPSVTFYSARSEHGLLAIGALKDLGDDHGELKSMHTAVEMRGRGLGRAMVIHLIAEARARGHRQVSLETGSMDAFIPARNLYMSAGFAPCPPFADYSPSRNSTFLTLSLDGVASGSPPRRHG